MLSLALSLAEADDTAKSNHKMVVHLAERRPWSQEWLELWHNAKRSPEDASIFQGKGDIIYSLAWHKATLVDLAYLLRDSFSDETFDSLVCEWKKII